MPGLVLAEVDYFLRDERAAMRKLIAEIFDPGTRYEFASPRPSDLVRALELDAKFKDLNLGLVDGTVAALAELTLDPRVAPRRILLGHPHDQASDLDQYASA